MSFDHAASRSGLLVRGPGRQPSSPPAGGLHPLADQVHHRRVGQRGDVTGVAAVRYVPQQPAHDLAGPGLRQLRDDQDLPQLGDLADLLRQKRVSPRSATRGLNW
jgi:hypothetical protein